MTPRIIVILLNWNTLQHTLECLASLQSVQYPNFAILVVDNASTDDPLSIIRQHYPQVFTLQNATNLGFAEGNNVGIRYALETLQADHVVLLNNDTTVDLRWLQTLVDVAEQDAEVGAVGSLIYYYDAPKQIWFSGGFLNGWRGLPSHPRQGEIDDHSLTQPFAVDYISGCALLMTKRALQQVGLIDPAYFVYFEDTDWCWRVRQAGFKVMINPLSHVWHKIGSSSGGADSPLHIYYMLRNNVRFLSKKATNFPARVKNLSLYTAITLKRYLPLLLSSAAEKRHIGRVALMAMRDAMAGHYGPYQGKL